METDVWENYITLNNDVERKFEVLGPPDAHIAFDSRMASWGDLDYANQLILDSYPLPVTSDREGYYGSDHFSYWASGLSDARMLMDAAHRIGIENPKTFLDLGCASGRVTRHTYFLHPKMQTIGCDINRLHVEWCNKFLPAGIRTFQNSSIPTLPLESNSVDILSAFSVFTHIEAMETAWLMEIRRILRPGGIAWLTLHTEKTLSDMTPDWPLWRPLMEHPAISKKIEIKDQTFEGDRLVLRWHQSKSYSSNIFYKEDYVRSHWGRIMELVDFKRRHPSYQDVIILRKD